MHDTEELNKRLWRLESCEAIRQLQARYSQLADAKYTADYQRQPSAEMQRLANEQAACFCSDAIWHGAEFGGDLQGRAALSDWFSQSPWRYAAHYYVSPEIEIDGHRAGAQWRLWQVALREDNGKAVFLLANVLSSYRYLPEEGWRIASMRFSEIQLLPASETPLSLAGSLAQLDARHPVSSRSTL